MFRAAGGSCCGCGSWQLPSHVSFWIRPSFIIATKKVTLRLTALLYEVGKIFCSNALDLSCWNFFPAVFVWSKMLIGSVTGSTKRGADKNFRITNVPWAGNKLKSLLYCRAILNCFTLVIRLLGQDELPKSAFVQFLIVLSYLTHFNSYRIYQANMTVGSIVESEISWLLSDGFFDRF